MSVIFDQDNLIEFLIKLTRFGIDQCLDFVRIIAEKQRTIESKDFIYQDKLNQLNRLLTEIEMLKNEFNQILPMISSADNSSQQLLFIKLQNYLSNFVDINFRFKSIEFSFNDQKQQSISYSETTDTIDIGKYWKFANIIYTRFQMSLIASNGQEIICYNNQNNLLHSILITGQFQGHIKWNHHSIIDIIWCAFLDQYVALTDNSIYTIEYNRTELPVINKVLNLDRFQSARIACNQKNILLSINSSSFNIIKIYNHQFQLIKLFSHSIKNNQTFCCTNRFIALTTKEDISISYFPYVISKHISLMLFDIETFELCHTIDLNDCSNISTMKSLMEKNRFFALSEEKILWIIEIDQNQTVQIAKKTFYTNQTEMCVINDGDLLLINVNAGHAIQLIKYRKIKS